MNREAGESTTARPPIFLSFYYGWFVVALVFLANLTAAGIHSAPSVLIHPLEAEFGWSRTVIASAASLNLLLLGIFAPVGGWLIDCIGARRVILGCRSAQGLGCGLCVARLVAIHSAVCVRADRVICLRRHVWTRLVRVGAGDHDDYRARLWSGAGRPDFRPGLCLSSTRRCERGAARRLGARAFRRLSIRVWWAAVWV